MKVYSHEEMLDEVLGVKGAASRSKYESDMNRFLRKNTMLKLTPLDGSGRVLLHSCCAPCSSAIIECMLANGLRPTVFYFNPNIYPREEYETRKQEAVRFVTAQGLDFVDADYDYDHWKTCMAGLDPAPDGDRPLCLRARLHAVYHHAGLFALEEPGAD